jgi:hypothetical protein
MKEDLMLEKLEKHPSIPEGCTLDLKMSVTSDLCNLFSMIEVVIKLFEYSLLVFSLNFKIY